MSGQFPKRGLERAQHRLKSAKRDWDEATGPYELSRASRDYTRAWHIVQKLKKELRERG